MKVFGFDRHEIRRGPKNQLIFGWFWKCVPRQNNWWGRYNPRDQEPDQILCKLKANCSYKEFKERDENVSLIWRLTQIQVLNHHDTIHMLTMSPALPIANSLSRCSTSETKRQSTRSWKSVDCQGLRKRGYHCWNRESGFEAVKWEDDRDEEAPKAWVRTPLQNSRMKESQSGLKNVWMCKYAAELYLLRSTDIEMMIPTK